MRTAVSGPPIKLWKFDLILFLAKWKWNDKHGQRFRFLSLTSSVSLSVCLCVIGCAFQIFTKYSRCDDANEKHGKKIYGRRINSIYFP